MNTEEQAKELYSSGEGFDVNFSISLYYHNLSNKKFLELTIILVSGIYRSVIAIPRIIDHFHHRFILTFLEKVSVGETNKNYRVSRLKKSSISTVKNYSYMHQLPYDRMYSNDDIPFLKKANI